ncbi:MAG: cytochrome c biogenesis protein ResB [Lachnospiraceae bacterium]|nr:cytochrome c biogenesis protein ResB [Lachnospiraceae bacterium]
MKNSKIYKYLISIRFAMSLLAVIAVLCVIDTVFHVNLIRSPLMYVLGTVFALSLIVCTVSRVQWAAAKSKKKFQLYAWGSPILHVGLIVVLLGGIISFLVGRQTYYEIPVGETAQVAGRSGTLEMKIDDFRVEYYEDGVTPRQYYTDLTLTKRDGESASLNAFVNGPARYDGLTIIQQSYGWSFLVTLSTPYNSRSFDLKAEEWIPLEDGEDPVRLGVSFYPDYDEDAGVPDTTSDRADNPRLLWVLTKGEEALDMNVLKEGEEADLYNGIRLTFDGYRYYTGLQAKYDPGVKVIFAGFFLVFAGLVIRYAFVMKQEIEEEKGKRETEKKKGRK